MEEPALPLVLGLIYRYEGVRLAPYLCPAGVPTVAAGCTHYADGRRVQMTDPPLSLEAAKRLTELLVRREYLPATRRLCPGADAPGRLAALTDFCFNLGPNALAASTLRRKVNAGRWGEVPAEFRKWVFAGGVRLRGLERRREAEIQLLQA